MVATARILLVEDEPLIAENILTGLEDGGFEIVHAFEGAEAVRILERNVDDVSALITDIRLADDVRGWEVARHGRRLNSGLAVIYISGDSAGDWPVMGVPGSLMIQKPFAIAQVVAGLAGLLNESIPDGG